MSEDTLAKLESHREDTESDDELVQELVRVSEQTGAFTDEGL